ncbi:hypothetical protein MMC11_003006 [Xylographa trunciseda]|nr:hypothetical protein [Xylographa trunciseda]
MHARGLTLSVRNLPPEATKRDVQAYFNGVVHNAHPFVGSLVKESQGDTLCATVTLDSEEACKRACRELDGREVRAPRGYGAHQIRVDQGFLGITPLADHEDPQFDYYFLHGLGGHAFETFASPIKKNKHAEQKMWARDLLPEKFKKAGLHGRFSTLGYNANVASGAGTTTIDSAAKDLLHQLSLDRPEGCRRPIFFVAHSLGGLVVSKALILALDDDEEQFAVTDRLRLKGLVKGIIFMGTPFWGSFTATALSPFVSALDRVNPFPLNAGLVKNLKANSPDLALLVEHFSQVRLQNEIDVKVFYESLPLTSTLITKPDSAAASLTEFVDPVSINANHVGMVKFADAADPNFLNIAEFLVRLTGRHIGGGGLIRPHTFNGRPPSYASRLSRPSHTLTDLSERSLSDDVTGLHISAEQHSPESANRTWLPPKKARSSTNPAQTSNLADLYQSQYQNPVRSGGHYSPRNDSQTGGLSAGPSVLAMPDTTEFGGRENKRNLTRLDAWDVVFVIDDTNSMDTAADSVAASRTRDRVTTRWDVLVRGMQYIADIAAKHDDDGVDVFFLCSKLNKRNVKDGQEILDRLNKVILEANVGGTYFEPALSPILSNYTWKYRNYFEARNAGQHVEPPKPMNIIVLTDGGADDPKQTEKLLVRVAKELDKMWAPSYQLGIQFVQVGDDPRATKYLKILDDQLEKMHDIRDVRKTMRKRENGIALGDKLLKILLGAMDKALDNEEALGEDEEEEEDPYKDL